MAADPAGQIEGLEAVVGKLQALEKLPREKSARFAGRKSANVIRDAAKTNAQRVDDPDSPENIAANVVVKWDGKHFRATGELKFRVGVLGGSTSKARNASNPGGDTWYWRLVEFGRGPVTKSKGILANASTGQVFGKSVAGVAAQPFMRPALEDNIAPATAEFVKHFDKAIVRAIRRANKAKAAR